MKITTLIIAFLQATPVHANIPSILGAVDNETYIAPYDGSYEILFETTPEPGKVYRVIFSTLEIVPSGSSTNSYEGFCVVGLEEMPNESASDYSDVIEFKTPIQSVIFGPNSALPMDAVTFEYTYECYEFDDMSAVN